MLSPPSQADEGALLSDPLLQRLFRLFMLFSDITEIGQQRITPEQTHFLINSFFRFVALKYADLLSPWVPSGKSQQNFFFERISGRRKS